MELVGRWWNGIWSRMGRRDIWLYRQVVWHVRARDGDGDAARELRLRFPDEQSARDMVRRLQAAVGPGQWRELTALTTGRPAPTGGTGPGPATTARGPTTPTGTPTTPTGTPTTPTRAPATPTRAAGWLGAGDRVRGDP